MGIEAYCTDSQTQKLAEVKRSRRQLDALSNQLSNRLHFLHREESKILKSVYQARSKAHQIVTIKTKAALDRAQLAHHRHAQLSFELQQRALHTYAASVTVDRIAHVARLVTVHKQNDARAIKLMKAVMKNKGEERMQRDLWVKRARVRELRQRSTDAPLSHQLYRQEKHDVVRNWREYRLLSEIQRRQSRLAEISALEEERMTVVQRLTHTQRDQEEAEDLLREALRESLEPL